MRQRDMVRGLPSGIYRRLWLTIGVTVLLLGLLTHRLQGVKPQLVIEALGEVGMTSLFGAGLFTWVSFRAVAGYDRVLHRHLATGIDADRAGRAGFAAIAIGQTVGMGVLSGALVRWRLLPELGFSGALRLSVLVALTFLMTLGLLCVLALCLVPDAPVRCDSTFALGGIVLLAGAGIACPQPWVPNLITLGKLVALAAVDCLGAGAALWLLLPGDVSIAQIIPAFLIALGAGLVSGAPAGLGGFEIMLLLLLPAVAEPDLIAAVVAWRLVYHAVPAIIGAAMALWLRPGPAPTPAADGRCHAAPQIAEGGLARSAEMSVHPAGFLAGRTRHGLVAMAAVADLAGFAFAARAESRWPVLYKAGGRQAVRARACGMTVMAVAQEAWLDPYSFRLDAPSRAGLRRKLRKALAAGVTYAVEQTPDWQELAAINARWAASRGGERGFSMGRFDPDYLGGQLVVVARQAGKAVGFASFHRALVQGQRIWTLDLMRPDPCAPDGVAHGLILASLGAARDDWVQRLSLAAVPIGCDPHAPGAIAWLGRRFGRASANGLFQFKSAFAPVWQPLYIAGPSTLALAVVGIEIWVRVHRTTRVANMSRTTRSHEEYGFASARGAWQRVGNRPA